MSKWAHRLKGTLAKTGISGVSLNSSLTKTDKTTVSEVSSVFVSGQFRDSSKNAVFASEQNRPTENKKYLNQELTKPDETRNLECPAAPKFTQTLNSMITKGASFDISTDDFQVIGSENLSDAEKHFLRANKLQILCTLQQSALKKYLSLSDLQMFVYEVKERALIISDGERVEPPFKVLQSITKEWFADMLEEITK